MKWEQMVDIIDVIYIMEVEVEMLVIYIYIYPSQSWYLAIGRLRCLFILKYEDMWHQAELAASSAEVIQKQTCRGLALYPREIFTACWVPIDDKLQIHMRHSVCQRQHHNRFRRWRGHDSSSDERLTSARARSSSRLRGSSRLQREQCICQYWRVDLASCDGTSRERYPATRYRSWQHTLTYLLATSLLMMCGPGWEATCEPLLPSNPGVLSELRDSGSGRQ